MSDWLQVVLALLMVLLLLSPLYVPAACFMAQLFLGERRPYLLPILPIVSGVAAFGWFPSRQNEIFRVFYCLDTLGAFAGSVLGGIVCAAVNWKRWLKR